MKQFPDKLPRGWPPIMRELITTYYSSYGPSYVIEEAKKLGIHHITRGNLTRWVTFATPIRYEPPQGYNASELAELFGISRAGMTYVLRTKYSHRARKQGRRWVVPLPLFDELARYYAHPPKGYIYKAAAISLLGKGLKSYFSKQLDSGILQYHRYGDRYYINKAQFDFIKKNMPDNGRFPWKKYKKELELLKYDY